MSKYNRHKAELLGRSFGAASGQLRKQILFSLIVETKKNFCYRCGKEILTSNDLSIDHKEAWMAAENPKESFFDLSNIAFSHLSCNISAGCRSHKKYYTEEEFKKGRNKLERSRWAKLSKEEQQKLRRDKYIKYGC